MSFSFSRKFRAAAAAVAALCLAAGTTATAEIADAETPLEGVRRVNTAFDPLASPSPTGAETAPAQPAENAVSAAQPEAVPAAPEFPEKHRAFLFESALNGFSQSDYSAAVEALFSAYEKQTGRRLVPGEKKKAALKIFTASGKGLATPPTLVRAAREALVRRGFAPENVFLVDMSEKSLRKSGYLPPFRRGNDAWEGSPVLALDSGKFYSEKWFYENPMPSREAFLPDATSWDAPENDRKSFLPVPLMFDADFWISLPVAADSPALGVSGALANATLWNVSNQRRFLENPANAAVAAVSIATIPEFRATFELTLLSLEKYQFIGGPNFYAEYTASEKRLWLSANPVILDYLLWQRMNAQRVKRGFEPILPEPPVLSMASKSSASLGSCVSEEITLVKVPAEPKK